MNRQAREKRCPDKSVTAPEIGYEVHDADGRYLGQVEAAWPVQRVWLVVDVDTGRDDALVRSDGASRRWLTGRRSGFGSETRIHPTAQ